MIGCSSGITPASVCCPSVGGACRWIVSTGEALKAAPPGLRFVCGGRVPRVGGGTAPRRRRVVPRRDQLVQVLHELGDAVVGGDLAVAGHAVGEIGQVLYLRLGPG